VGFPHRDPLLQDSPADPHIGQPGGHRAGVLSHRHHGEGRHGASSLLHLYHDQHCLHQLCVRQQGEGKGHSPMARTDLRGRRALGSLRESQGGGRPALPRRAGSLAPCKGAVYLCLRFLISACLSPSQPSAPSSRAASLGWQGSCLPATQLPS